MKNLLTILIILFAYSSQAQVLQEPQVFGMLYRNLGAKEGLLIPTFCGTPTLPPKVLNYGQSAIAYDSCNHLFYVFDPTNATWGQVSGNSIDSSAFHTLTQAVDSSYATISKPNGHSIAIRIVSDDEGGGGGLVVHSVTGSIVNNTDPANPVVNLPYILVAGSLVNGRPDSASVNFVPLVNTSTATSFTVTRESEGRYIITANQPIFSSGVTSSFMSVLPFKIPSVNSVDTSIVGGSSTVNYILGRQLGDGSGSTYEITMGSPTDGLQDGLIPNYFFIEIKIYPFPE
jgi:hypothetical protein